MSDFSYFKFYENTVPTLLSATSSVLSTMEADERAIVTGQMKSSIDKDFGYVDPIQYTQNPNVSNTLRGIIDYINGKAAVYKTELETTNNIMLILCSQEVYKFLLVVMRNDIVKQTGFLTYGTNVAFVTDVRLEPTSNDSENLGDRTFGMFSSISRSHPPQMSVSIVDKTTYMGGIYNF